MARGHIRRRSKNSFQIVVSGGFDPITGRRNQAFRTVHGTMKDAERELTSLQALADQGRIVGGASQNLAEYLAGWLDSLSHTSARGRSLAPTTHDKYERAVGRASAHLGQVPLSRLTARHIERLRDHLIDEGKLGAASISDVLCILSQALNRAASQGLVARNVAAKELVSRPTGRPKRFTLIGPDLAKSILARAENTQWDAAVHLALGTTLRREEILALRWSDVDLDEGTIRIDRAVTYAHGKTHVGEPKTAAGRRTLAAPSPVLESLRRAKAEQNRRRLLLGSEWVELDLIVDRGDGAYWIPPSFSTGWRRFAKKAGFADVPMLGLRHGSATLMLAAGVPDPVAAQIMGHSDTRILRRYQDVLPELKLDAARRMGELLGG